MMKTATVKDIFTLRIFFLLLAFGFSAQIILGLYAMLRNLHDDDRRTFFRLKPRYQPVGTEVRGATYRIHKSPMVDLRFKEAYEKRRSRVEGVLPRPHLVARRDILAAHQNEVEQLLSTPSNYMNPSGDDVELNVQCNTCSIVGITGTTIEMGLGESIDQSDCVFRLGLSPTKGFENDLGRKTTIRVLDAKSIFPLLLRPQRFMASRIEAENLVIFNTRGVEDALQWRSRLKMFARTAMNADSIYTLTKTGEHKSLREMQKEGAKLGYSMAGFEPSALWHAIQVAVNTGCSDFKIVGVPDSKYCKRHMDSDVNARYWDRYSPSLCRSGGDVGLGRAASVSNSILPSLADRRAVLGWANDHNVTFDAPPWPSIDQQTTVDSIDSTSL